MKKYIFLLKIKIIHIPPILNTINRTMEKHKDVIEKLMQGEKNPDDFAEFGKDLKSHYNREYTLRMAVSSLEKTGLNVIIKEDDGVKKFYFNNPFDKLFVEYSNNNKSLNYHCKTNSKLFI